MQRFLIVGSGSAANKHLALIAEHFPQAKIALWKRKSSGVSNQIELISESEVFDYKPTISIVASPAHLHLTQAGLLLNLGSHLLIEKPISISAQGVKEIYEIAKEKNSVVQVAYNLRFSESLTFFEELINLRSLGDTQSVTIEVDQYLPTWRPGMDYRQSVSAQKGLGGGALLELSHEIDYAIRLFGPIQIDYSKLTRVSDLEIDVEDSVEVIGTFSTDRPSPVSVRIHLGMANRSPRRFCEVVGSETSARWNGLAGTVEVFDPVENLWELAFSNSLDISSSYDRQLLHFLKSVSDGFCETGHTKAFSQEFEVINTLDAIRNRASSYKKHGATE
jgi:predicted dehydrogenase